jgi:hypothetical protein
MSYQLPKLIKQVARQTNGKSGSEPEASALAGVFIVFSPAAQALPCWPRAIARQFFAWTIHTLPSTKIIHSSAKGEINGRANHQQYFCTAARGIGFLQAKLHGERQVHNPAGKCLNTSR